MTTVLLTPAVRDAARAAAPGLGDDAVLQLAARAAWSCLVEPGDRVAGRVVAALGPLEALERVRLDAPPEKECEVDGREWRESMARWSPRMSPAPIRTALDAARRIGATLLTPEDIRWPAALADLDDHAPLALWVRGDLDALSAPSSAAIIGARAATGYGEHVAMEIAGALAGRGVSIVSGAAYGIDGAAHRASLAVEGSTVALLAGGVDRPYPAGHTDLIGRIASTGTVISELPCGSAPTRWRFLARNRLIAALAGATVVVEAGARSGSINTAGHAAALGRPLGAVPGPVTSATSAGCHRLLREYDAVCITGADDVLELMGWTRESVPVEAAGNGDATRVKDALSTRTWRRSDEIAHRAGMSVGEVEAQLGLLELSGDVVRGERGWRGC